MSPTVEKSSSTKTDPFENRKSSRRPFSFGKFFRRVTSNPVEIDLREYEPIVAVIKQKVYSMLTEAEIRDKARVAREQLTEFAAQRANSKPSKAGPNPHIQAAPPLPMQFEIEVFALVREAARRALRLEPFDVQLIAGLAMARRHVAELPTGEGKTLAAVFPAALHAMTGRGAHILTFNDYLARRDAAWMGPIFELLGLSVGYAQEGAAPAQKRAAYLRDVTYATAKEAGFDFLRDRIAYDRESLVHRPFHFALIDEADSIMIDEARIPLVISGAEDRAAWDSRRLAALVRKLAAGRDYETDDEHRNVFLTEAGAIRVESLLSIVDLYAAENQRLLEAVYCALHAEALLRRDIDYIVRGGRIEIVDEFTGRVVDKRHWPDGLQAAVEAKEGLARKTEGRILGSITLQHFFRLYPTLCGMTATARSGAHEFQEFYGLNTAIVPPHTPSVRFDHPDEVFTHRAAKRRALVEEIRRVHGAGRPILVGTANVKESEELAAELRAAGVALEVLNARNDEREAGIIAEAGRPGAVTISTNMAGRGTDIKLGGADESGRGAALAAGGLYVIGTNRHESLRIDRQLRGRSGRQGDPGSTRFFISLEDDLFERYGLTKMFIKRHKLAPREDAVPAGPLHHEIEHAQRIIEGQSFDMRRSLTKYSMLIEIQRGIIQSRRDEILLAEVAPGIGEDECPGAAGTDPGESAVPTKGSAVTFLADGFFAAREPELFAKGRRRFGPQRLADLERRAALFHLDRCWSDHLAWVQDTRESIHLVSLGGKTPIDEFQRAATDEFMDLESRIEDAAVAELTALIEKADLTASDLERLKGPSSTWTYLVNEDQFGWGMELVKGRHIGYSAISAAAYGPLLIFVLLIRKLKGRKKTVSAD
jgi:preprotein translocase subunit SecA